MLSAYSYKQFFLKKQNENLSLSDIWFQIFKQNSDHKSFIAKKFYGGTLKMNTASSI